MKAHPYHHRSLMFHPDALSFTIPLFSFRALLRVVAHQGKAHKLQAILFQRSLSFQFQKVLNLPTAICMICPHLYAKPTTPQHTHDANNNRIKDKERK